MQRKKEGKHNIQTNTLAYFTLPSTMVVKSLFYVNHCWNRKALRLSNKLCKGKKEGNHNILTNTQAYFTLHQQWQYKFSMTMTASTKSLETYKKLS